MINEKITIKNEETSLNIVQGEIESIRKKNITKTGYRVYDDNKIGVAGVIGKHDENEMKEKAKKALSLGIEYPYEVTDKTQKEIVVESHFKDGNEFSTEIQDLLIQLRKNHPEFIFSNKINFSKEDIKLENDLDLNLRSCVSKVESSLLLKEKTSPNLIDGFIGYESNNWDRNEYLRLADMTCHGLKNTADIDNGYHKVVLIPEGCAFLNKMYTELHGLKYGTGGSIFTGKAGQKLFSDDFTLYQSLSTDDGIYGPFFDVEGTVNENFKYPLIENGVIKSPYTDKKTAKQFNLNHTGAAGGNYDSVPTLSPMPLVIKKSDKTLKELLNGEKVIFVLFASGGDFTPEGKYATPVQTAFLFDGENFIGKLPQLNMTSNIYDMFGKDFLGVSSDSLTTLSPMHLTVMNMKIEKI